MLGSSRQAKSRARAQFLEKLFFSHEKAFRVLCKEMQSVFDMRKGVPFFRIDFEQGDNEQPGKKSCKQSCIRALFVDHYQSKENERIKSHYTLFKVI